ncbi:MAG: hypothetical protein OES10_08485 [Gammaproteobacteria bacterium]|nr:hypothetical protein [Gammaproteobacteria bacterium]
MRPSHALLLLLSCAVALADDSPYDFGGHTKFRLVGQSFPDDSLFRDVIGSDAIDVEGDLRLNLSTSRGRWSFNSDYQLFALHGDSVQLARELGALSSLSADRFPDDQRRLFDLTHIIDDSSQSVSAHRLDRLWVGYTSEKAVVRFGRQALSWGNGLFYSPMDLVNPFDPAAIDTEFKTGDDMLYLQYLRDSGDDVQGAAVFRRDPLSGDVESDQATVALKYHGFLGESEYDVLVAESYGDTVLGVGGVRSIGGAVVRGDVVVTDTSSDTYVQAVANVSYSWTWGGRNISGAVEYYFNGFGQQGERYDPLSLASNPDLLVRLARSELFTLGRNYLAGSLMIEMSPLWTLTPTLLANLNDPSALLQFVTQHSLSDNMTFLGSLNIPLGSNGTEFGGIDSGIPDRYLSSSAGVFAQFAWYF